MKFNHNNQPKSFPLVSFLGLVAIAYSIVTTAINPLSNTKQWEDILNNESGAKMLITMGSRSM